MEIREKDKELAEVLNGYNSLREHLLEEMEKVKQGEESYLNLYKIKNILGGIKGDMHDSKKMILGIRCQAKRLGDESPFNDYSKVDYGNPKHIKHMLK